MLMNMKHTLLVVLIIVCNSSGVARAFCNWGPNGDAASSVCQGGAQGGSYCNANRNQCEAGCGGKWCSTTSGFCNWGPNGDAASSMCQGGAQGGSWCNANQNQCQVGCGGKWCTGGSAPVAPPVARPTGSSPVASPVASPPTSSGSGGGSCPVGWQQASWTYYHSYAACCPGNPNYDPNADTTECVLYSACDYSGQFAYIPSKSYDYVKKTNLIAFYTTKGGNSSYGNKQMLVSAGGKTIKVLVADTCGDSDCNGCCTANAQPSGNLIDMEANTVLRNFGSLSVANGLICWKMA